MNVGITGVDGFIGAEVAQFLKQEGMQLVVLDDLIRGPMRSIDDGIEGLDWVMHFAARTSVADSWDDPIGYYHDNVDSTLAALEIARKTAAHFLYMSSYVYASPTQDGIKEDHSVAAGNPYMASKIAAEDACRRIARFTNIPLVILRAFSIYGEKIKTGRLIGDLLACVAAGKPLCINDPMPQRDYLAIADFCDLVLQIVQHDPPASGTYNVGSGISISNLEVAELIRRLAGDPRPLQIVHRCRKNDVAACTADISKVRKVFGWSPGRTLESELAEIVTRIKSDANRDDITPSVEPQR